MSLELLPTLEKDVVSKKKTATDSTSESKKEGSSLFDSLLKDAVKKKPQTSGKQDSSELKDTAKETSINTKKVVSQNIETLEDKETPVKKMVNSLVDMVVDESKKELNSDEETKLKNIFQETKELKVESKENNVATIKQTVQEKVEVIKETANEISKVTKVESVNKEEVDNQVKLNKKAEDLLEKVEQKVNVIKETTSKIKEEIQVVVKQDNVKDTDKALQKETIEVKVNNEKIVKTVEDKLNTIEKTTNEIKKEVEDSVNKTLKVESKVDNTEVKKSIEQELPTKIEQKVEVIKENVGEIQKEIQKVVVSSDELVKKIQEFKSEAKVTIPTETSKTKENNKVEVDGKANDKNTILSNGFLTSQKQEKQQVSLANIHNAKTNLEEKKTVGAVKESAKILELNPQEVEVEKVGKEGESKSELFTKHEKQVQEQVLQNKSLNKIIIEGQKNSEIINEDIQKKVTENKVVQEEAKSNTKNKETVLNLNVPQTVVETIQSKIIGAHQRVGSFMSEVARNMYLNYKPPFTSFRMNLNPDNLGTISIIMRANNKDSNLNVSMQMSNNATLDSFVENKVALQNALQRQLGENSNITLNFGMEDSGSFENFNDTMGQSNGQNNSQESSSKEQDTQINNIVEQEQTTSVDYM